MTIHPVHPADLSAYYDDDLRGSELSRVEDHLAACAECRSVLAQYGLMAKALREEAAEMVPMAVEHRVRAMVRARGKSSQRGWFAGFSGFAALRPALAGVAVAAVLLAVVVAGLPFGGGTSDSRVASAYLSSEDGRPTIEVHFTGPVDRESVGQSVKLDPPVDVTVSWRGDTMVVKPVEPLHKSNYVLSLKADGRSGKPAPVSFNLPPAPVSTPLSLPTKPPAAAQASTATPSASAVVTSTAIPAAAIPAASITPTAQRPTITPGPVYPVVRGFGLLLRGQPAIAASLGAALEAEHPVEATIQSFQKGLMAWRSDRKEIYAIVEGWGWRSFPDNFDGSEPAPRDGEPVRGFGKIWREQSEVRTMIGSTTSSETPATLVIQRFEHGQLVWTADRKIYVLFESGAWDRHPDLFQDATLTPTAAIPGSPTATPTSTAKPSPSATPTATATQATNTPTATASPTVTTTPALPSRTITPTTTAIPSTLEPTPTQPTAAPTVIATRPVVEPTATATATPTPRADCPVIPRRGFGLVYSANPALAARLGCATAEETGIQVVRQAFEQGLMIWRSDTKEIVVIRRDGEWSLHKDSWKEGEVLADAGTPPAGLVTPVRGFGKLWRQSPEIRMSLGWATGGEQQLVGSVQNFAAGEMVWTADKLIYLLLDGGDWRSFADSYAVPTPTARPGG